MSARATATVGIAGALAVMLLSPAPAAADGAQAQVRLGSDVFLAGAMVAVREPVSGDLIAVGGAVELAAGVAGDVSAAAGKLQVDGAVEQALHAAAGELSVTGRIGGNARVAGGEIEFGPRSEVLGHLAVAGGQVRLLGAVRGDVQAAGGHLRIDGPIGGDVLATAGQVVLGPNARIAGKLRYRGAGVQRDPAAQVVGGVESWGIGWRLDSAPEGASRRADVGPTAIGWLWTGGLVLLAAALIGALPRFCARVGRTLQERPGLSVALGLAWLLGAPLLLLVLLLTVIALPLALLGAALYVALLPVGYVSAAIALGDWALRAWRSDAAAQWAWRLAAAALVLVLLWQSSRVPWLGAVLGSLVLLAGLGALALQWRRRPDAA